MFKAYFPESKEAYDCSADVCQGLLKQLPNITVVLGRLKRPMLTKFERHVCATGLSVSYCEMTRANV